MRGKFCSALLGILLLLVGCAPPITIEPPTHIPTMRPPVMGQKAGVSAGHPLTTAAAFEILVSGGNAFDAGVAALLVGGVVEQDLYSLGGEALILVYPQSEGKVTSIVGQGWAPRAATISAYTRDGKNLNGAGLDPAVVPGALHAALTVLERWGTMSFESVAARAISYAREGFPLRPRTAQSIRREKQFISQWPHNRQYWLKPSGSHYLAGETIKLPTLANTLKKMVEAEQKNKSLGRKIGIAAARDRFYRGDIAQEMVKFLQQNNAPFDESDFAEFYSRIETPTSTTYRGYTIYKQSFNSQGPMLLQTLNILENFNLVGMGRNSADYVHTVIEAMKLAFADRDSYYADPDFVSIPAEGLLSKAYAKRRAQKIDPVQASEEFRAGNPLEFDSTVKDWNFWIANSGDASDQPLLTAENGDGHLKDTTHIAIIDEEGNVFDSTPSGGWIGGAVILGDTGIAMSVRGEQFWLDETKAAQLRPRSRPRYTLTPTIVLRDGEPFIAIGTPGGDNQEQTILQILLNILEFWPDWYPNLHAAIQWPRFQTLHYHDSFWPHATGFNRANIEITMPPDVIRELETKGHNMNKVPPFAISGCATVVLIDPATGNRMAGADARRDCYAMAY